ncbi:hypothetical protein PROFUN_08733 [Planoprotostelium fungivorum]|uniref:Transmembrane 9 superfamily member n=1 Tax=Planoprotostelium fungivorum TaxID=1890364 RepID=A0A2P6ND39_9EUKA|nr:hypothetical protein PROFUN_08733 [Planoprotostelium fungivorum]
MTKTFTLICRVFILSVILLVADSKKGGNHYAQSDVIPLFGNKIGPYSNPSERYGFYDKIKFCRTEGSANGHKHSLKHKLTGDRAFTTGYDIHFRETKSEKLCTITLESKHIEEYKRAIDQYYQFEMEYDGIPLFGFVGVVSNSQDDSTPSTRRHYYFAHLHFHFLYNKDQVIYGNITADLNKVVELKGDELTFDVTYSSEWSETDFPYSKRAKYAELMEPKSPMQIHWLSIMNSIILVLLLTGFLTIIILRILKNDYTRYALLDDEEDGTDTEDYGWKLVHGDVFRFPQNRTLFCALIGLGCQFLAVLFGLLILALVGVFYPGNDGNLYVASIVLYALTSVLGGFVSASFFKQFGGEGWAWNIVLVGSLYTIPSIFVFSYVNTVAIIYNATNAVPVSGILTVLAILIMVGFPLNVIGGIAGRRSTGSFEAPCRTKNFPREIPPIPFYRSLPFQMLMSGFLPFSAIYTELRYLFESTWGHKSYQLFGILFLVAIILLIVTACITIALTYFQLSMEDHRWWWNSFLNGGSTGIFIYGYSIFFYKFTSHMTGTLQSSFYFAYMLLVCFFFFVMLGTVGFYSSLIFVRRIYRGLKID